MSSSSTTSALTGALKALSDNPLDFLKKHEVLFEPATIPKEYRPTSGDGSIFRAGTAGIKLVLSTKIPDSYNLTFVAPKDMATDKDAVNAFVVGYNPRQGDTDVPFVDIPIRAYAENTFLFTVGLTGCSVVVTRLDATTYRVFHDRRMDSSVLYANVQWRVDFNNYRIGGRYLSQTGKAIALMLFKGGVWSMYLQRQLPVPDDGTVPKSEVYAVRVDQANAETEVTFNNRRTILQNRVRANGKTLKVADSIVAGAVDGVVRGVEYSEQAISGWNALRAAIKVKIDEYNKDPKKNPALRDTYQRFADDNSQSKSMDETWIWLQIRKNRRT